MVENRCKSSVSEGVVATGRHQSVKPERGPRQPTVVSEGLYIEPSPAGAGSVAAEAVAAEPDSVAAVDFAAAVVVGR